MNPILQDLIGRIGLIIVKYECLSAELLPNGHIISKVDVTDMRVGCTSLNQVFIEREGRISNGEKWGDQMHFVCELNVFQMVDR